MNGLINKIIAVSVAIAMQLPAATLALAQSSPDIRSPVIELNVLAESPVDNTQVFTAQVIEDVLLKDVFLYHRRAGKIPFTPIAMEQVGDSNNYSVALVTDPTDLQAIEYYVQARDEAGNRTVEGFAFDPYTRVLIANATLVNEEVAPTSTTSEPAIATSSEKSPVRWWHIVAGIVVVGAVASLASGDKSDGTPTDNSTVPPGTVPLTVTVPGL